MTSTIIQTLADVPIRKTFNIDDSNRLGSVLKNPNKELISSGILSVSESKLLYAIGSNSATLEKDERGPEKGRKKKLEKGHEKRPEKGPERGPEKGPEKRPE